MRTCPQKMVDFWDDPGFWNQLGLTFSIAITLFVGGLEVLHALYGS